MSTRCLFREGHHARYSLYTSCMVCVTGDPLCEDQSHSTESLRDIGVEDGAVLWLRGAELAEAPFTVPAPEMTLSLPNIADYELPRGTGACCSDPWCSTSHAVEEEELRRNPLCAPEDEVCPALFPRCSALMLTSMMWVKHQAAARKARSELLGLSGGYIDSDVFDEDVFVAAHAAAEEQKREEERTGKPPQFPVDVNNPNFHNIAGTFAKGKSGKGYGLTCPRDGELHCSVVDAFDQEGKGKAGRSTHFLSWSWGYPVFTVFKAAIRKWMKDKKLDPDKTFIWVCFFCNNQYRIDKENADNLQEVFMGRVKSIGKVVAMLDTWENPIYFTRVWCVFEQFVAFLLGIEGDFIMPEDQSESFKNALLSDPVLRQMIELEEGAQGALNHAAALTHVKMSLTQINVREAQASHPPDAIKVKGYIECSLGGFARVNTTVKRGMVQWCVNRARELFPDLPAEFWQQQLAV